MASHQGPLFVRPSTHKAIPIINPTSISSLDKIDNGPLAAQTFSSADSRSGNIHRHTISTNLSSSTAPDLVISDSRKDVQKFQGVTLNPQPWIANVYARPYIPKSLTDINILPATVVPCTPLSNTNFQEYVSSFAGNRYLVPHVLMESLASKPSTPVIFPLTVKNYQSFFEAALVAEFKAESYATISYSMYKVQLQCRDLNGQLYELQVPGLREDIPKVNLGDTVLLRQLRPDHGIYNSFGMELSPSRGYNTNNGFPVLVFTGFEYYVSVWGIDKVKEKIVVKINAHLQQSLLFNAIFPVQSRRYEPFQRAVADISYCLNRTNETHSSATSTMEFFKKQSIQDDEKSRSAYLSSISNQYQMTSDKNEVEQELSTTNTWMRKMLFPEQSDGMKLEGLPKGVFAQTWFDQTLNYEQQKAVDSILTRNYGVIPFLISGPPGTGKTKTVVEAALQLVYGTPLLRTHILLCAPSDPAADILALRIKAAVPDQDLYKDLFRLNSSSRSFAEVPDELLPYCHINNNQFSLPEFRKLMSYRLVVTTCHDADILVKARVTNRDLVTLEKGTIDALHFGGGSSIGFKVLLHWSALLIDEAAQATEPEAGVSLTVVAPPEEGSIGNVVVVMAGDQFQLGPRLFSQEAALSTSLFERLFERPIYKDHPLARRHALHQNTPPQRTDPSTIHPPFTNLFRNYRSHASILAVPSALFYADTLQPAAPASSTSSLRAWSRWRGRRWPVLFACNADGHDTRDLQGWGWTNAPEVTLACAMAASLVTEGLVAQRDICIMSPFRAQVQALRRTMRAAPYVLRAVNIGPVEAFQGLESRMVILCTTRTARRHWEEEDRPLGLGVVGEAKRFNVAVTRARHGLVVIGNPGLLCRDEAWKAFLGFCWRHGLWEEGVEPEQKQGSKESDGDTWVPPDEATPPYISSLERGLVYNEELDGRASLGAQWSSATNEDDAMWVSGHVAEDALREY